MAITLDDHPLMGTRIWYAEPFREDQIMVGTDAFEIPRTVPNAAAAWGFGREDMQVIWERHFTNIDQRYFGGNGELLPYVERNWVGPPSTNPHLRKFFEDD